MKQKTRYKTFGHIGYWPIYRYQYWPQKSHISWSL